MWILFALTLSFDTCYQQWLDTRTAMTSKVLAESCETQRADLEMFYVKQEIQKEIGKTKGLWALDIRGITDTKRLLLNLETYNSSQTPKPLKYFYVSDDNLMAEINPVAQKLAKSQEDSKVWILLVVAFIALLAIGIYREKRRKR